MHNPFGAYLYILLLYELLAARFLAKNAQKQISGQEAQERIYISAIKFCNGLIIYQKIGRVCLAIYLFMALLFAFGLFSATFITWLTVGIFVGFDVPAFVINRLLARPIIFGRFKEFSFEKYHNTENHDSLL